MNIKQNGFTLIELMMVIAIIGILAAVAVPQYSDYTKRSKYVEIVMASSAAKTGVLLCYQEEQSLNGCSGDNANGSYPGIPDDITSPGVGLVDSITTVAGKITAKGHLTELNGATYILEASEVDGRLSWSVGGTCLAENFCKD